MSIPTINPTNGFLLLNILANMFNKVKILIAICNKFFLLLNSGTLCDMFKADSTYTYNFFCIFRTSQSEGYQSIAVAFDFETASP